MKTWKKIVSIVTLFSLLLNSYALPISVLAQEATSEPEPTPIETQTPEITPTPEATPEETQQPIPTETSISEEITPTPEATIEPTTTPTTESNNSQSQESNPTTQGPPSEPASTQIPTPTPTLVVDETIIEGEITATYIETVDISTPLYAETLVYDSSGTPTVITDKEDYAPTAMAFITGENFEANKTYSLTVSSTDEPATSTTVDITTDSEGNFTYTYQLDGIYRPNYLIEVKDDQDIIAVATFTDSVAVIPATGGTNIQSSKAQNGASPAYTTLGNITINEGADGDFAANQTNKTLVLTAPSNWTFNPGVGVVTYTGNSPGSADLTSTSISVTANTITVTFTTDGNANKSDVLTISGIQVRAVDGTIIPSSGNILRASGNPGDGVIGGITNDSTNFGSLSQTLSATPTPTATPTPAPTSTPSGGGNQSADLDQYANDAPEEWVNGNLGASKSTYYEGDSIPYRLKFDNLTLSSHVVIIEWDTVKSGKHATDYLTTYDRTVGSADPCIGVAGCGAPTTFAIPVDPQVSGAGVTPVAGNFTLFGGTITGVSAYTYPDGVGFTGDRSAQIAITFTANQANPVLAWAGHIATRGDWGNDNSAVNIAGSPYHMRLIDLDGSGGNQDRSLSADAVIFPAIINITKDAQPNDSQDFAFTTTGTEMSSFSLDDDTDNTLSNTKSFSITTFIDNGGDTKTITESQVGGWSLTGLTCDDSNGSVNLQTRTATVVVVEGEVVNCTFTNVLQNGTLTVQKTTIPAGDLTEFTINATGSGTITDGGAGVITDANDKVYTVTAGTYSVQETVPDGWSKTGDTCQNVVVTAGQNSTCTITNTKLGKIIVEKQTDPDGSPEMFGFQTDYGSNFELSDGQTNDSGYLEPGTGYSVSEDIKDGWDLTNTSCVSSINDTESANDLELDPGEIITCTFTNTQKGHLIVDKITDPSGSLQSFDFTATGENYSNFSLTDASDPNDQELVPGVYGVSETVPNGWDQTSVSCSDGSDPSSINISAGETVTCTFNNQQDANIVVIKQTNPDGNQTNFEFDTNYSSNFFLSDGGSNDSGDLNPGVYGVSEIVPLLGWDLSSATCSDGSEVSSINLSAGETVTCTFTNTQRGSISGYKFEDENGDGVNDQDWSAVNNWIIELWQGDTKVDETTTDSNGYYEFTNLVYGAYTLIEQTMNGWFNVTSNTLPVTLVAGESDEDNNFVNAQYGTIVVEKQTLPDGSTENFEFNASYHDENFLLTDGFVDLSGNLLPGTYSVTELPEAGWDLTNVVCSDQSDPNSINLSSGESVTCTFTNTQRGHLIVEKTTIPADDPQVFGITATGSGTITGGGEGTISESQNENYEVTPGTYSVTEDTPGNWVLTSNNCEDIEVSAGETETCQIVNTKTGNVTVTKYHDHNANGIQDEGDEVLGETGVGAEIEATRWEINLVGTNVDASQWTGSQVQGQVTFSDVASGDYVLSETIKDGWTQSNIACTDTDQIDNDNSYTVTVNPGDTTFCSIGNYQDGSIRVFKNVDTDGDGDVDIENSGDWLWELGTLDYQTGIAAISVNPGTYPISEFQGSGYHVTDLTCSDTGSLGAVESTQVTVSSNEDVVCTFTNARNTGNLQITKLIDADGDLGTEDDRTPGENWVVDVDPDGQDTSDPTLNPTNSNGVSSVLGIKTGTYWVNEDENGPSDNYHFLTSFCSLNEQSTGSSGTSSFGGVEVTTDSTTYCTFINARDTGEITVDKITDPSGDAQEFNINLSGESSYGFVLSDTDTPETITVPTGFYSIAEEEFEGWDLTDASCVRIVGEGTINLDLNNFEVGSDHNVFCSFTNTKEIVGITIEKSNDKSGGASIGDTVTYNLVVTNTGNQTIFGLDIIDVLPGGFSYVLGTTDGATSNDPIQTGSKLTWENVTNLEGGESIELSYRVQISNELTNGTFINFATCTGQTRGEDEVNCNEDDSSVTIGSGQSFGGNLVGQVLGLSTELPATGNATVVLILTLLGLSAGLIIKKKYAKN